MVGHLKMLISVGGGGGGQRGEHALGKASQRGWRACPW